jgi:hypothetical protein
MGSDSIEIEASMESDPIDSIETKPIDPNETIEIK